MSTNAATGLPGAAERPRARRRQASTSTATQMTLSLATGSDVPSADAGVCSRLVAASLQCRAYRLEEISIWSMARAQYQILDDMFGRLVPRNEPFLSVYLSGEFSLADRRRRRRCR